jgi:hypothetical protein
MKNSQALATVALFCLLVALTVLAVFRFPASSGNEKTLYELFRSSVLYLQQCTKLEAGKGSCGAEFSEFVSKLDNENSVHFDFYEPGFIDVFIKEEMVVLRRRPCVAEDVAGRVIAWSAWSQTEEPRAEAESKYGRYSGSHYFDVEGYRFRETCLLVIVLPLRDLKRLYIALLNAERTMQLWKIDHEW